MIQTYALPLSYKLPGEMLTLAQSPEIDKATIAFLVAHARADLLMAIWENPVLPLLLVEDPYLFSACSRRDLGRFLATTPGIPPEMLRWWLVAFPPDDPSAVNVYPNSVLRAHIGAYYARGGRPVWEVFTSAGSQYQENLARADELQGAGT